MSTRLLAENPTSGDVQLSWGVTAIRGRQVENVLWVPDRLSWGAVANLFAARGNAGPPILKFKQETIIL